jgi:zinc/manganese transport system substrate-binding protein
MKPVPLAAVFCLAASFAGAQALNVVATTEDLAWFARKIGGADVVAEALARGDQDLHRVAAKPAHLLKLKRADLLVQNGLDLEHAWIPALLENSKNARIKPGAPGFVNAAEGIAPLEVPTTLDRSAGLDFHPRGNPHYLSDPEAGRIVARNVAAGLTRVRPARADAFKESLAAFERELDAKLAVWNALAAPLKGRKFVVRHGLWPYLAQRYGMVVVADLEPKPGLEPSPAHVAKVIEIAKRERIAAVLAPTYAQDGVAKRVADEAGCPFVRLPVGATGRAPAEDWFAFVDHTLRSLVDAAAAAPASRPAEIPASRG